MPKGTPHPELLLEAYGSVCVSPKGVYTSPKIGPVPVIQWSREDILPGSYVILKKVNLAIAWIILAKEVKEVYADTVTSRAADLLDQHAVSYSFREKEEPVSDEELCMWEKAVLACDSSDEAMRILYECALDASYPHVTED